MKVLILGATGMLGHKLYQVLGDRYEVYGTVRQDRSVLDRYGFFDRRRIIGNVDAADIGSVRRSLDIVQPDVVINAIGAVKQTAAAKDLASAIRINSILPHDLAILTGNVGSRLITISTDCVFSGVRGDYDESDLPDASDPYGISKRLGESCGPHVLVLRTSIVGRELASRHGLVEWFLSNRGKSVNGYVYAVFNGLTTIALAKLLGHLVAEYPRLGGLYHVSSEPITKFDLLETLNKAFATETLISPSYDVVIDRSLDSSEFRSVTGWHPPGWGEMIEEVAADSSPYETWRLSKRV